ncbi:MAG: hypothetical protein ABIO39_05455 [Caulobacteraceae bacterium]
MPRYFFDITDGTYTPDLLGTELPGLEAARLEAVVLSGALLRDNPAKFWSAETWLIEVKDEEALVLFTLSFMATEVPRGQYLPPVPKPAGGTL